MNIWRGTTSIKRSSRLHQKKYHGLVRRYSQFVYKENKKIFRKKKKDEQSAKKMKEMREKLKKDKIPPFTLENLKEQESVKIIPPSSLTVRVHSFATGEPLNEQINLPPEVFATPVRPDILHRYVRWHLANLRQGNASSKRRGEVRGSTRKLYQQKKTGRARRGSIRSPLLRHGGKSHGPKPKDWSLGMNRKIKKIALRSALSAKFAQNSIIIVDNFNFIPALKKEAAVKNDKDVKKTDFRYTAPLVQKLQKFKIDEVLMVDSNETNFSLALASRNLYKVLLTSQKRVNVYDILRIKNLMLSKEAISHLKTRTTLGERIEPGVKKVKVKLIPENKKK